jgi:1-acyl-sn-glycerol-3-phosphate acyltransferase
MPLPPLPDPASPAARARGLATAVPASAALFAALLGVNAAQLLSLGVRPFSRGAFRALNRRLAALWLGLCSRGARALHGVHLVVTGDPVPPGENAVVVANHQQMPDVPLLAMYAATKDRAGDLKFIVKEPLRYVPGLGWGMAFVDCIFVKRRWTDDRATIERTFARLVRDRVPFWLTMFPEGTRLTPRKLERSRAWAELHRAGAAPRHVLVPRTRGFAAAVSALRPRLDAIYDVTIGYEGGVPTLWQYVEGFARVGHVHVRRFPVAALPTDDAALAAWLRDRFAEKDELLEQYYRDGVFPGPPGRDRLR